MREKRGFLYEKKRFQKKMARRRFVWGFILFFVVGACLGLLAGKVYDLAPFESLTIFK